MPSLRPFQRPQGPTAGQRSRPCGQTHVHKCAQAEGPAGSDSGREVPHKSQGKPYVTSVHTPSRLSLTVILRGRGRFYRHFSGEENQAWGS